MQLKETASPSTDHVLEVSVGTSFNTDFQMI